MRRSVKRASIATAATAITLGLAASAPLPRRETTMRECPSFDMTDTGRAAVYNEPASRRAANFGAFLLGYAAAKCEQQSAGESVAVDTLANGALWLTVTRRAPSRVPSATEGEYILNVVVQPQAEAPGPADVVEYTITESAYLPGRTLHTFMLSAGKTDGYWTIGAEMRTKLQGGGAISGDTGRSLPDADAEWLLDTAQDAIRRAQAGEPTAFAPVRPAEG